MSNINIGDMATILVDYPSCSRLKKGDLVTIIEIRKNFVVVDCPFSGKWYVKDYEIAHTIPKIQDFEKPLNSGIIIETVDSIGGTKHDTGKNRLELIPVEAIEQIGLAYTFGAKKYTDNNWRGGFKWTRLVAATLRHTYAWLAGEDNDPESGLSHLAHAGACLTMLIAHEKLNYGEDDRVKTKSNV